MRQSSSALLFALFLRHTCITLLTMTKRRQLKISNLPHLNMSSISDSSTWDWCIAFTNQVKWGRTHPRSDLCTKTVLYSKHPIFKRSITYCACIHMKRALSFLSDYFLLWTMFEPSKILRSNIWATWYISFLILEVWTWRVTQDTVVTNRKLSKCSPLLWLMYMYFVEKYSITKTCLLCKGTMEVIKGWHIQRSK